jgi:uncharacterized protein involved in exopolysaccharide biosynthesis
MLNILEAFFRRPWLHLIPLILMVGVGISSVINMSKEYTSGGSLRATSGSVISDVTESANQTSFGFESPASATAREINELLRTEAFVTLVAERSEIPLVEGQEALLKAIISASTSAFADGDQLVRVTATTDRPDLSELLATATIETFVQFKLDDTLQGTREAEQLLQQREQDDREAVTEAQTNLRNFYTQNGITDPEDVTAEQSLAIAQLESELARAEARLTRTLDDLDQAESATTSARAEINQRFRQVGAPGTGVAEPVVRKAILTMAVFVVLGIVLSLALVLVTATLDRTIRVPNDITAKYGLDVLAVVPNMRR